MIQVKINKNYKIKIVTRSILYIKLAIKFFLNKLLKKIKQMLKQFIELIKPFLAIKLTIAKI